MNTISRTLRTSLLVGAAAFVLAGCATSTPEAAPAPADDHTAADHISIVDAWTKSADEGMSAAFGGLVNESDHDVTVISATSDAATMIELHETVASDAGDMVMQEVDGGFVIPAGETFELTPGGNHLMFMGLTEPLVAGNEVEIELTFDDESTYEFTTVVKDYSGANETYVEGEEHGDMGDGEMDHGDMGDEHTEDEHTEDDAH